MKQSLTIGLGGLTATLLAWNTVTLWSQDTRLAALEAAQVSLGGGTPAVGEPVRGVSAGSASTSGQRGGRPALGHAAGSKTPTSRAAGADIEPGPVTLLGLDNPEVKEAFENYLDDYLQARREDQSYNEESDFLDHASAAVELYGEDASLSDDVQEQIVQRLETANTNWFAIDRAIDAGELDSREALERRQKIEASVTSDMIDLLGEEAWEDLAGRIW